MHRLVHMQRQRMRRMIWSVLGLTVLTLGAATADADAQTGATARPLEIKSAAGEHTIDCDGRPVSISGATNEITLNGECPSVTITGAGNIVSIDTVERISVTGAFNKVTWQRAKNGAKPRVSVTGTNSSVSRASDGRDDQANAGTAAPVERESSRAAARRDATSATGAGTSTGTPARLTTMSRDGELIRVLTSHGTDAIDCNGRELTVVGSDNRLTLRGTCPLVRVTGSENTVDADTVGRFLVTGSSNRLTWTRAASGHEPDVTNTGRGNVISQTPRQ